MPAQYSLDPTLPDDAVRVTDPSIGLSRVLYDPAKAAELRSQQQPGYQSPMAAAAGPAAPLPSYITGGAAGPGSDSSESTPGPFDDPGAPPAGPPLPPASTGLPAAQPGLAPPSMAPTTRGSMEPPPPPPMGAGLGIPLHGAKITPGTPGRPYDQQAEDVRHEGLIDRKLELQGRNDQVQTVLNDQSIQLQQQAAEDEQRRQDQEQKTARYSRELEQAKQDVGPMSKLGALSSVVLGLVGLFVAKRSANPGVALSRMNQSLDQAITKDIEIQRHEHDSTINRLTNQLGDAQQAELMYRGNVRRIALDRVKNHLQRLGEDQQYGDLMRGAESEVQTIDDAAKAASFNKPGIAQYDYERPKPVKGAKGAGDQTAAIAALPPGVERYQAQELAKLPTIRGEKPEKVQADWSKWNEDQGKNAEIRQAMSDAGGIIKKFQSTNDVSGKGLVAGKFPQWLISEEGRQVRQQFGVAEELLTKEWHGVRVPPETLDRVHKMVEGTGTYDDMKFGLAAVDRAIEASNKQLDGTRPEFARIRKKSEELMSQTRVQNDAGRSEQEGSARGKPALPVAGELGAKTKIRGVMSPGDVAPDTGYRSQLAGPKPKKPIGDYDAILGAVDDQESEGEAAYKNRGARRK